MDTFFSHFCYCFFLDMAIQFKYTRGLPQGVWAHPFTSALLRGAFGNPMGGQFKCSQMLNLYVV